MQHCPFCITAWVDRACAGAGLKLTDLERRRLIAAMLARRHLILSGHSGIGKRRLAHALALSIAGGREDYVCVIQGHPWWAAQTGNIARYVGLQTKFSTWRLADFIGFARHSAQLSPQVRAVRDSDDHVICVERMSPIEIDFYFGGLSQWLLKDTPGQAVFVSLRLIGTYDSDTPPDLDDRILRVAALVHLSSASRGDTRPLLL